MSYADSFPAFASEHRGGLIVSVVAHLAILLALSTSVMFSPKQPLPMLAIEAVVIDEGAVQRAADAEKQKAAAAEQKRVAEQKRADQARQAEQQAQRQAEQKRAEEKRQATEKARIEEQKRVAEQKALEEQKRLEAEARAEAERQRMIAEAEREEQERREAELKVSMAEEEALQAARASGEMSRYLALIQQKVERNWTRPATAKPGLECDVSVRQLPNGDVIDARTTRCNGDDAVRRSIENAVRRSSPLPLPENRVLFDRNLLFTFKPE
ncbi:MAG: cell envelope integrity protein TolA [Gammaproteobacteria bacterium]